MSILMDQEKLQAIAEELAKGLKTPEDLSQLSALLTKLTVEAAKGRDESSPMRKVLL